MTRAYASLCAACHHLVTDHRLREGGELVAGPYDCTNCDCAIPQDAPFIPLSRLRYEHWLRTGALFALLMLASAAVFIASPASAAVAPGCTAAQPTFFGGTIRGQDGRAVDAHIGWTLYDSTGRQINTDGSLYTGVRDSGYTHIDHVNQTVPADGTTDPAAVTTWGVCVTGKAVKFAVEAYPKAPGDDWTTQPTTFTRYGEAAWYNGYVTPGTNAGVVMRLPVIYQVGGNTGGLQGYVWYAGRAVPKTAITRVRAFSQQWGTSCGVEGLAASAAAPGVTTSADGLRTYYKVDFLAAGQCWAASQLYSFQVTCTDYCGAAKRVISKRIYVRRGMWPRVDVTF